MTSQRALLIGWCIGLFLTSLFLYTRHNTFPVEFHADEPPKAAQVMERRPTYRQPLLLITMTDFVSRLLNKTQSIRQIVLTGRVISAIFAAAAVSLIALFAYVVFAGRVHAAVAVGLAALSCPQLLLLSHYMKEDTALVFAGVGFLLAVWYNERQGTKRSAALLGIATALVASAKYVGLLAVPLAYWFNAMKGGRHTPGLRRTFVVALIATWCAINYLVLVDPLRFFSNLATEAAHPVAGHHGLANPILFSSPVWQMLAGQANFAILMAAFIYLVVSLARWRRLSRARQLFLVGPAVYLILLSLSRFVLDRHLLPVTVAAYTMAGFAIAELAGMLKRVDLRWVGTAVLSAVVIMTSIPSARAIYHELNDETRLRVRTWIRNNLSQSAVIAQDRPTHLNITDRQFLAAYGPLPQRILTPRDLFVTDLGSIADLRNQGVTHIVTCDEAYSRIFSEHVISAPEREEYHLRRARYEEIFSSCKLVFEAKPELPIGGSTSPVVGVYAISDR